MLCCLFEIDYVVDVEDADDVVGCGGGGDGEGGDVVDVHQFEGLGYHGFLVDAFEGVGHDVSGCECFEAFVVLHCSANVAIGDYADTIVVVVVNKGHTFASVAYGIDYVVEKCVSCNSWNGG